ncbi:unnamed protein product [Adineta steineri]|uniref:Uncharacterized protein n=1 Tax=Adineta steineri TaxID=433720 RepID=A0A814LGR9_9BILA|nr:unnamed protein product [Adineta steineri]CAF4001752.1 unnamed protein product [Adineta steineri]
MQLFIIVLSICLSIIKADPQQDWYKTQLDTHVLPPFSEAHRILRVRILNELVSVNVALLTDATVTELANRLLCATRDVRTYFDQSVAASDNLRSQTDTKITTSVTQVGAYEQNIVDKNTEIHQTDQYLLGAQAALASAEQAVRDKEQNVRDAESALSTAEDVVEKAKKCHGLFGKRSSDDIPVTGRGWFSSITRPIVRPIENAIKDVIIKPVCSVINMGPVDSARNRRDSAYNELQNARNQLKKASTQLSSVNAGSIALQSAVTNMIDFDQLLAPLNAIYAATEKITAMTTTMHVSSAEIQQAKVHLAQIAILVPNIPFNMNTDLVCA